MYRTLFLILFCIKLKAQDKPLPDTTHLITPQQLEILGNVGSPRLDVDFKPLEIPINAAKWDAPNLAPNYLELKWDIDTKFKTNQLQAILRESLILKKTTLPTPRVQIVSIIRADLVQIHVMRMLYNRRDITGKIPDDQYDITKYKQYGNSRPKHTNQNK